MFGSELQLRLRVPGQKHKRVFTIICEIHYGLSRPHYLRPTRTPLWYHPPSLWSVLDGAVISFLLRSERSCRGWSGKVNRPLGATVKSSQLMETLRNHTPPPVFRSHTVCVTSPSQLACRSLVFAVSGFKLVKSGGAELSNTGWQQVVSLFLLLEPGLRQQECKGLGCGVSRSSPDHQL